MGIGPLRRAMAAIEARREKEMRGEGKVSMEYVSFLISGFEALAESRPDERDIAGYALEEWLDYATIGWDEGLVTYFVSFGDYDEEKTPRWDFARPGLIASPYLFAVYLQSMFPAIKLRFSEDGIRALRLTRNRSRPDMVLSYERIDSATIPAFQAISQAVNPAMLLVPAKEVLGLLATRRGGR